MPEPTRIEWDVGRDIHGRTVKLIRSQTYLGKTEYQLNCEPISQRDDGYRCWGLSLDVLNAIARVASEERP